MGGASGELFGEDSLRRVLNEFVSHHRHERNHQGRGNIILFPSDENGRVNCLTQRNGLRASGASSWSARNAGARGERSASQTVRCRVFTAAVPRSAQHTGAWRNRARTSSQVTGVSQGSCPSARPTAPGRSSTDGVPHDASFRSSHSPRASGPARGALQLESQTGGNRMFCPGGCGA